MKNVKTIRLSKNTEPAKACTSLLFMLEEGNDVELIALGTSAAVLAKVAALSFNLSYGKMTLSYHPRMEVIHDSQGIPRSAVIMLIKAVP
ncbi:hypothetical protein [Proteiniclasticum ruminis]|uniref:Stage V sporulation protein S n=1 Tax=Proteiniclasticum ruminis TaxID=398199 RepID=A0A1G8I679_9CLOT|nr:hypothetical protein [Proteiniclasticum ruminis]SDI14448.1 hypothetical protein SAMN05421804_101784 [Proteiniclasticum ruminis]